MAQLVDLGRALAQLRSILGLSIDECAARIEITPSLLIAAERGDIDQTALQGIARLFALDEDELRAGMVMPTDGATVFLLHGAYTEFDARDLGVLGRAMRMARLATALADDDGDSLQRRLQFVPVAPAGPWPADAARQGYKLARQVRAKLGLGGEPIDDMADLLAQQLGIVVIVDTLESTDLRAASILDAHRAAAAALLAARDLHSDDNPTLARVYLAHELCHLLFDPGSPGTVRLVLDNNPGGGRSKLAGPSSIALLESRAKGFAAEFLIPLEGLKTLLGDPVSSELSLSETREMVAEVRHHFSTPWEIAVNHLENLGFIPRGYRLDLFSNKPPSRPARHSTQLSAAGALPRHISELLVRSTVILGDPADTLSATAEVPHDPPPYFGDARTAARRTLTKLGTDAIESALRAIQGGREIDAVDILVEHLDDLFLAGEFEAAQDLLTRLDPQLLPPKVLTGVLMVCSHARDELGDARTRFFSLVETALTETWHLSSEQISAISRRLK